MLNPPAKLHHHSRRPIPLNTAIESPYMTLESIREPFTRRPCLSGALFWIAFSLVAVLVRGVRWDENYEFAQVILGQIPYPEGHPLYQYVRGFYSLQTYSLAALMYFAPGPLLANLLRNWAFLAASTVPVYLLGALFSRRQLAGHIAVVLVLLEIHTHFYSTYPVLVWPMIFSNGAIGLGYMLVALWALLDRRYRLAGCMMGFAPAMHLGQFPPLLLVAILVALRLVWLGQTRPVRALVVYSLPGLTACALFALFLHYFAVAPPLDGPYFTAADPQILWRTFMERYPGHRALPLTTGHIVLVGAVLTGAALWVMHRTGIISDKSSPNTVALPDHPWTGALLYCFAASAIVWIIMAVHYAMGPDVPYLLLGWLPYRLMNHVAPILIPLLVAIGFARHRGLPPFLILALSAAILAPLSNLFLDGDLVRKYVSGGEYLFFFLYGGAVGTGLMLAWRKSPALAGLVAASGMVMLLALAWFHQFGAACTLAGIPVAMMPLPARISPRMLRTVGAAQLALLLLAMLASIGEVRSHLYRSDFHREVAEYLGSQGKPDAMILVQYDQAGDQAQFGHPVTADMATMLHGVYRPAIAPSVNAIFQDFYGVYLDPAAPQPEVPLAWHEVWPAKSLDEWQQLSRKYGVEYVAAPRFMNLPLDLILRGDQRNFFHVPAATDLKVRP